MPRIKYHNFDQYARNTLYRFKRDRPTVVAIDTETTGFKWIDKPFAVSVSWWSLYGIQTGYFELDNPTAAKHCAEFFEMIEDNKVLQVYFNAKFDITMLLKVGLLQSFPSEGWFDVLIPTAYTRPSGMRDLKSTARDVLGKETNEDAVIKRVRKELKLKKDDGYWPIPREYIIPYAEMDAKFTLELFWHFSTWRQYNPEFISKELKVVRVLTEMEYRGLLIDRDRLKKEIRESDSLIEHYRSRLSTYVGKLGKDIKKGEFNPNSGAQIISHIFNKYGIHLPNAQSKTLQAYSYPELGYISRLKKEEKLLSTYLRPALSELDQRDILHPNFKQFGTNTGRFSSGGES